ncbi:MAG: ABC transporter substrate-binding protein [Acetobacteraceae bacterium]|nr:ABC transporter substrate-binding protein [Acetobacteraceae bacterium]
MLAGAMAVAAGGAMAQPTPELRLGALFPLTGPHALLGDEGFRGLELAAAEQNAGGGIAGARLRLIKADAADQAQAVAEARRLVGPERAQAVFGTHASSLSLAATQVTDAAGIPHVELHAIADQITERGFRFLFRTCPTARQFGELSVDTVAAVAQKLGVAPATLRIAILHEEGPGGTAVAAAQKARILLHGYTLCEEATHAARGAELSAVVQRLRAAEADIVLHRGQENDIVLLYRGMREAGWKPKAMIGCGEGYSLAETARAVGPDFENTMNVDITQFSVSERAAPGARGFAEAYVRAYGHPPRSGHSLAAFVGARVAFDAFARAGGMDRERVRAAFLATDIAERTTPNGWGARFDEAGQNQRASPFVMQWQGEQLVTIAPPEAAGAELRVGLGTG